MQVGMDFGWLLDRFWMDFGRVLGAKLGPKSIKNLYKIDMKIWLTISSKNEGGDRSKGTQAKWAGGVSAPKSPSDPGPESQFSAELTVPCAKRRVADIYIYIYIIYFI